MAKKRHGASARSRISRKGHGGSARSSRPEVPQGSDQNIREFETLTPAFVRWYGEQYFNTDVVLVLGHLSDFFRFLPESKRSAGITALEPTRVAAALASLMLQSVDTGVMTAISVSKFLHFLRDSGRWTGNTYSFRAVDGITREIILLDFNAVLSRMRVGGRVTIDDLPDC